MAFRYITFSLVIVALMLASTLSAAPHWVPDAHPGNACMLDPAKTIGSGYQKMWPGKAVKSFTSGTGKNNAWLDRGDMYFSSGENTPGNTNYFMMKIFNKGQPTYVKGFILKQKTDCNFHIPTGRGLLTPESTFEISQLSKNVP